MGKSLSISHAKNRLILISLNLSASDAESEVCKAEALAARPELFWRLDKARRERETVPK